MKTMLFKHIFMKIRQNYKRFLSLLFMALLGIGFYAGIEACSPDMLKTLDKFYDDNNVYDILIFSNLGLDDNDIDRLSNIDGVDKVIGSYEKDTYLKLNNEQYVIKVIGLNDNINKVYIEDGRLPNNNDEIVVEKKMIVDNNLSIGDSIDILGSNKKIIEKLEEKYNVKIDKSRKLEENVFVDIDEEFEWPDVNNNIYKTSGKCYGIRDHVGILVDGSVVPCCLDGNGSIKLGNIFESSLDSILNSKRALKMVEGFKNKKLEEELCKHCGFIEKINKN